jgi:hypothetical protein
MPNGSNAAKRNRQAVARQALIYAFMFVNTYIWITISTTTIKVAASEPPPVSYTVLLIAHCFYPLQGFFIFIIYIQRVFKRSEENSMKDNRIGARGRGSYGVLLCREPIPARVAGVVRILVVLVLLASSTKVAHKVNNRGVYDAPSRRTLLLALMKNLPKLWKKGRVWAAATNTTMSFLWKHVLKQCCKVTTSLTRKRRKGLCRYKRMRLESLEDEFVLLR